MKLKFEGWDRTVHAHRHQAIPVGSREGKFYPIDAESVRWHRPLEMACRVEDLRLTGNFLLQISFSPSELRNWLLAYAQGNPEEALALLGQAHAEAIKALVAKSIPLEEA